MSDHEPSAVEFAVGGSTAYSAEAMAAKAGCPQGDDNGSPKAQIYIRRQSRIQTQRAEDNAFHLSHASRRGSSRESAFTLAELLVTMGALVLLVFLFTQLLNSAATVTVLGNKKMDADSQARQVFDRMAIDFAQMVKRPDVEYYLKSSSTPPFPTDCAACGAQAGNDQAAFYSTVPGYYAVPTPTPVGSPTPASPESLVSYRINSNSGPPPSSSYNMMQRMCKALAWNGLSPGLTPVMFLPQTVEGTWPSATSTSLDDSSYEVIGSQVFRFEYYYLLTNGQLSSTPWYSASSVRGLQDVAAIIVDIAVIDPRSKVLVSDCQLAQFNGAPLPTGCSTPAQYPVLIDWRNTSCAGCPTQSQWQTTPGLLVAQWRAAIDANASPNGIGLLQPAISGIRVYERYFYLTH